MAHDPRPTSPAAPDRAPMPSGGDGPSAEGVDDLVEDVSIDGMCGVY